MKLDKLHSEVVGAVVVGDYDLSEARAKRLVRRLDLSEALPPLSTIRRFCRTFKAVEDRYADESYVSELYTLLLPFAVMDV